MSSSEEENSVEAGDAQDGDEEEGVQQPSTDVAFRKHVAISSGKRKLTRSLDMSSSSITSSRRARLKTSGGEAGDLPSVSHPASLSLLHPACCQSLCILSVPSVCRGLLDWEHLPSVLVLLVVRAILLQKQQHALLSCFAQG